MQIHELNNFIGDIGDHDYFVSDNGFDTTKISGKDLLAKRAPMPLDENGDPDFGSDGQGLRSKGDGTTEWADIGLPTDAQTAQAVSDWLAAHPEATTTVQDGSITEQKLASDVVDILNDKPSYNVFNDYAIHPTKLLDIPAISGYYPQGFAFDGTYFYCGYLDTLTYHEGIIVKYNSSGVEVARSTDTFGHVNNLEIVNGVLYVATTGNIFTADMSTLAKTGEITCRGGAAWCACVHYSGSYGGIPNDQYIVYTGLSETKNVRVFYGSDVIKEIDIPSTPLTQQGATGYNGYIYAAESVGPDIGLFGIITIYDTSGKVCARINTNLAGELEDISIRNNVLYLFGSFNGAPAIYTVNIANLVPYLPVLPWYQRAGERYKATLTYSSNQVTKITVAPIVDVYLFFNQPISFFVDTNAICAAANLLSNGGFEITFITTVDGAVKPAIIRQKYTRSGNCEYSLSETVVVSLIDGTITNTWSGYPKINGLAFTLGTLVR